MGSHTVAALVLLLRSWNLLLAQTPTHRREGPDFSQGFDQNSSFSQGDALKQLFEEQQDDPSDLQAHSVFCGESAMQVVLREGSQEVNIIGLSGDSSVLKCPDACGCFVVEKNGQNILEVSYSGCHVLAKGGKYILRVLYRDGTGQTDVATVSCADNPTQMASPAARCLNQGWCSNTVSREADLPSTHQDAVPWMSPAPEMPRKDFGTHLGSVPWMPLARKIPRDVTGMPSGPVPWMPSGPVPWMPLAPGGQERLRNVPRMTLAPESPRDVPGKPLGSVFQKPLVLEKLQGVPPKFLGFDPWMIQSPEYPRDVAVSPGDVILAPETSLGAVPWMPLAPGQPIPVPGTWWGSVSSAAVGQEMLGDVPRMTLAPESPRDVAQRHRQVPGKPLGSVFPMPMALEKLQGVPHKFLGFDPWMIQSPESPRDVTLAPETSLGAVPGAPRPRSAAMTFLSSQAQRYIYKQGGCSVPASQRLPCLPGATAVQCLEKGCCVDSSSSSTCYYPMNDCTADGHFVFAIPSNITSTPLNLAGLTVAGNNACSPVIADRDVAVFKFPVTECGTHSYKIGLTTIYFAEVQSAMRTLSLKYGIITRDEFFRLIVECRYSNFSSYVSAGYMVMNPSLPAVVRAKGLYGVQLRIAEDKTFTRFLPHYHQPLRKILGRPVYLEVRLNSPKPEATLLVHYCVAYPRSASSVLILLFDGCPNSFDSDALTLYVADAPQNRHKRRFQVKAFEFVNKSTNKLLNEEIYFMCSTEVCMPSDKPCTETCFEKY